MQKERVLDWLKKHKGITAKEAMIGLDVQRLSGVIYRLRQRGYKIINVDRTYQNRYGEISHITQYRLEEGEGK